MPYPKLPPTPAASSDITALERHPTIETAAFVLPPPAMSSINSDTSADTSAMGHSSVSKAYQPSTPTSPAQKQTSTSARHKRTSSGSHKAKATSSSSNVTATPSPEYALPPPPQRTRKIIQMTPKVTPQSSPPWTSSNNSKSTTATASPKRKQPSSTSAAGRKIARKTAHSIIERRRRSKMNEEFGVLKDMIPACSGQEMHKLAILQAGIEYMRYLEGCVGELKGRRRDDKSIPTKRARDQEEDEELEPISPKTLKGQSRKRSVAVSEASPDLRPTSALSAMSHHHASRNNSLTSGLTSASTSAASTPRMTPAQSLLTPAFGAIQFSPEMQRHSPYVLPNPASKSTTPSPNILPMSAMSSIMDFDHSQGQHHPLARDDKDQEATATAALMMLTHDRRGFGNRSNEDMRSQSKDSFQPKEKDRDKPVTATKGMSVRDLLST